MSDAKPAYVEIAAGDFVFREGEAGSEMYIIESGMLDVLRHARGPKPLAELGPGDFFGEMAILEDQPRFASVRARTPCRLLRVDRAAFAAMLRDNFEIAVRIMRKLVARLRRTEEQLQQSNEELAKARGETRPAMTALPAARPLAPTRRTEPVATPAPVAAPPTPAPAPPAQSASKVPFKLVHRDTGSEFSLALGRAELLIGRPDPVTGTLPEINLGPLDQERTLSRRHAKIVIEGDLAFLREEVGTTNGTYVNGTRLKTGIVRPLNRGDVVRFGSIELDVESL